MTIRILSNNIINRIAAGEVVERPASVVKELVENAIDAGATKIDILIENAGKNLITIIDNGCGMSRDELELSVERHATSKLPDDDINNIEFFGFRGEALPSIASISRMSITSKSSKDSSDFAWKLNIEGGTKHLAEPASLSIGTKIEVRDLFFATPARLKFLRSEKTEINYIEEIINKISMANPSVSLSLSSDGKELLRFKNSNSDNLFFDRISELAGKNFNDNFIEILFKDSECKISGFISTPTYNSGSSAGQYFFVNKRPVNDKLLSIATKIAYQDFIPQGRYPFVYIFLDIDPAFVDVNVHPAKSEVRFKDTSLIKNNLIAAIRNGIRNIGKQASSHLGEITINSFVPELKQNENKQILEESDYSRFLSPQKANYSRPPAELISRAAAIFIPQAPLAKNVPQDFDQSQTDFPLGSACGQIHETYIISQSGDAMFIIDQHAAHERIFYERLKDQFINSTVRTQRLLIPEIIDIADHLLEKLIELKEELARFGLYFSLFGNSAIAVSELPALLNCQDVKKLIYDIIDDIKEYGQDLTLEKKVMHYLATFSCHHSIRAGKNLSIKEMNELLRQMEQVEHTGQCNHGRPTYIKLSMKDIEKLFERT